MSGGEPGRHPSPLPVDSLGMWEATTGLPEQMVAALEWDGAGVQALSGPITNVVVAGHGRQRHRRRPGGRGGRRRDAGPGRR